MRHYAIKIDCTYINLLALKAIIIAQIETFLNILILIIFIMPKYVNIKSYSIKIRKTNCFFLMCLLVSFAGIMPVRSQEKTKMVTVEGTVVDETETPVIGANVYIKGSTKGVSTNVDGNFILQEYLSDRLSLSLSLVTKIIRCGLQKGERN